MFFSILKDTMYFIFYNYRDRRSRVVLKEGTLKEKGCSWMELNGSVHHFAALGGKHSGNDSILLKLDEIIAKIKVFDYAPKMEAT
uniref:Uncharacterized protein n=1 Tax=Oryza meridionalis TaxID=40149 RepID=A0A0E0F724_9ORYZ